MQGYLATLWELQADGAALTNSTAAASLLGTSISKYTLPATLIRQVGDKLLVKAAGRISTVVTTPGTLTLDLRLGSTVIATSGALTLSTTAKTNVSFELEWMLTARAVGTAGNFMHQGILTSEALGATTVAGEAKSMLLPVSAPAVGSNVDMSAAAVFDIFGTWSVANASNSIQLHQAWLISA